MAEGSIQITIDAVTVEVFAFSPDGDPPATVIVSKVEAMRLVSLPLMLGHTFRAAWEKGGIGRNLAFDAPRPERFG